MITIVDYGMGNLGSVANMIKYLGYQCTISSEKKDIINAEKIILPGVGHFDKAMKNIRDLGLVDNLMNAAIHNRIPMLGICLGMHLLCKESEEGQSNGLGLINASIRKFTLENDSKLKLPHMGWNYIQHRKESSLFTPKFENSKYYFVHSFHAVCEDEEDILTTTEYGYNFHSSFERGNVIGVQFHPEKSHKFGMQLINNFITNY